jgi:hypothetical protein
MNVKLIGKHSVTIIVKQKIIILHIVFTYWSMDKNVSPLQSKLFVYSYYHSTRIPRLHETGCQQKTIYEIGIIAMHLLTIGMPKPNFATNVHTMLDSPFR